MCLVSLTWLITREAEDASAERDALLARGHAPVVVPCVETVSLEWPWAHAATPSARLVTLFTSRRSVEAWVAAGKPALGEVAAIAPATAEALLAEGVAPTVSASGGVLALSQQVLAWWQAQGAPRTTLRYPTSNAGLHAPEQVQAVRILSKLLEVDRQLAYEVRAPDGLKAALERAAVGDWAVSFSSPSAVNHFFSVGAAFTAPPRQVECRGGSTRRAWHERRPAGWPDLDCLPTPAVSPQPEVSR